MEVAFLIRVRFHLLQSKQILVCGYANMTIGVALKFKKKLLVSGILKLMLRAIPGRKAFNKT